MANHKSAVQRARQTKKKTEVNRARTSRVRTFVRKVEEAIASGDQVAAKAALQAAQPELARAAQKGITKKNTASRKVSRLASRVKKMSGEAAAAPKKAAAKKAPAKKTAAKAK